MTVHTYEGHLSVHEYDGPRYLLSSDADPAASPADALDAYEGKRVRVTVMVQDLDADTVPDFGEVSDGYHTFNEYEEFRMLYNAALFNHWALHDPYGPDHYDVHKSRLHYDGSHPFNNPHMFVVRAQLPTGQISNHYHLDHWDLFKIPERERAGEWDGHSTRDAADRLRWFLNGDY